MKEVIINNDKLTDKDITEKVYRARGFIVNSNDEILLGSISGNYQFPGGHTENDETMKEGLIREIQEETGIVLDSNLIGEPFYIIKYYNKDWPVKDNNRYTEFNYFLINTDEKYNLDNTNYDEYEKTQGYTLKYIKLDNFIEELNNTMDMHHMNKIVYPEMIDVYNAYIENKNKKLIKDNK